MNEKTLSSAADALRQELASLISEYKAHEVPTVCARLGLERGIREEAVDSKYAYVSSRLAQSAPHQLMQAAEVLLDEIQSFRLNELMQMVADNECPAITRLTRRSIIKVLEATRLSSEVEDNEFVSSVFPLQQMPTPTGSDFKTLAEYLSQKMGNDSDFGRKELLETLGILDCSISLFSHFIEQLVSPEYQDRLRQQTLVQTIGALLNNDGYGIFESGVLSGAPVFRVRTLPDGNPADQDITAALNAFEPSQIGSRWQAALESKEADPQRAITLSRTLLEDVCKWLLDEAGESWEERDDLSALYRKLSRRLNLAPDNSTEQVFKQILSGSQSVVVGLGSLRNKLGDAHSIGPRRARPSPRHAELAVNLSGTIATFLVATWKTNRG